MYFSKIIIPVLNLQWLLSIWIGPTSFAKDIPLGYVLAEWPAAFIILSISGDRTTL